jgi:hypothetical protein
MKPLTLALIIGCSAAALAQQQSPSSIPKELVVLLMRGGLTTGDSFDIVLGAPAGFPAELLPPGAKPLISTVSRTGMMVIAEAPNLTSEAARMEGQLTAAGWTAPARYGPPAQRGLLSSAPSQGATMWCRGDRYASISTSPRPEGGSYVRISVNDASRGGPCAPMPQSSLGSFFADVDLPLLFPPPGSQATGGTNSSSGLDFHDQRLRLQTTLSLADVLQHYRSQLEKHGWKYQSQAIAEGLGMVRFSLTSSKNEPVVAILRLTAVPGDPPLEVGLHLVRAPYRPFVR